jgi:hypothetical protein
MEVHDMSDELFEVAFSGQIREGENPEDDKARIGKMFNADEAKIAQLFSGNRIVIKKNVDQQTAAKYQTALNRAGAECEVKSMSPPPAAATPAPPAAAAPAANPVSDVDYGDIAPPPKTDPLGITGDEIEDLSVSIAPIGSALQDDIKPVDAPQIDISEFEVAPVGADLAAAKKQSDPPPPDTAGLSMADE